jgi:hypothetical protein
VLLEWSSMVLSRAFEPPDLLVANIAGLVTSRDQTALVEWVRDTLEIVHEVRLLVVLHRFSGWKPDDAAFDDPRHWLHDEDHVSKMAIVGDPRWRVPMLTFLVQPLRRTPIKYFETEAAARQWLGVPAAGDRAVAT